MNDILARRLERAGLAPSQEEATRAYLIKQMEKELATLTPGTVRYQVAEEHLNAYKHHNI